RRGGLAGGAAVDQLGEVEVAVHRVGGGGEGRDRQAGERDGGGERGAGPKRTAERKATAYLGHGATSYPSRLRRTPPAVVAKAGLSPCLPDSHAAEAI